jgi:PAS domain S-box-containing protein
MRYVLTLMPQPVPAPGGNLAGVHPRRDLARALAAAPEPMVLLALDGTVTASNPAAALRFPRSVEGAAPAWRRFELDGAALLVAPETQALGEARVVERRLLVESRDGERLPTLVRAVPLWERDGSALGVLLTFVDAARDARAETEAFRRAFDLSDELLLLTTPEGRVLRVNEGATRMLGWPAATFLGSSLSAMVHPEDRERSLEATSSGHPWQGFVSRVEDQDGAYHLISWTVRPERSPTLGPVVYLRGVDVTQAQRREEELVASREQLAEAQDIAHIGTVTLDYRTRRLETSAQLRRLLSLADDAKPWAAIAARLAAPDRARLEDAAERGRQGIATDLQLSAHLPQGPRELKVWARPHADASGQVVRLVAVVQDITDEVRLAAQLRLGERLASLGTLAAGIAHEVNNPLAFVVANLNTVRAELARVPELPGLDVADLRAALSEAQEGAERVASIVANLKSFSRGDEERTPAPCDVRPILEGVLNLTRNETRHRARVTTRFASTPLVMANQARLGQVFLNLVLNAAQAIPDGHVDENLIAVGTTTEDGAVVVTVSDTGQGIAPEHLAHIFDPFFSSRRRGQGTGMGLFIAQGIVRELGGDIGVESAVGAGTTFRVRIPATDLTPPGVSPAAAIRRRRVLLVDDEPLVLRSLSRTLGRTHDITTASNGKEALTLLTQERFDLVLCDLLMPELSGIELWERLGPEQRATLVFMTGGSSSAETHTFLEEQRPPVLQKPFSTEALVCLLERRLGGPTLDGG